MFLKANSKILWRLTDVLMDRIPPQFWSILILESVYFIYATKLLFVKDIDIICHRQNF